MYCPISRFAGQAAVNMNKQTQLDERCGTLGGVDLATVTAT